jgi:hypothetical protein
MSATISGLMPIDAVLANAKYRKDHRSDLKFDRAVQLGLHWQEGQRGENGAFYAKIDGKEMKVTNSAVKTACRMVKAKPEFFKQSPDPDAFPKWFRNVMDAPTRRNQGILVRHNGIDVEAILPSDYQVRDTYDFFNDYAEQIGDTVGDIAGVQALERENGAHNSYRIICGTNIMPQLQAEFGQYMMFSLNNSETGLRNDEVRLGLYRTTCTNSAVPGMTHGASWNHRSAQDTFNNKVGKLIRTTSYYRQSFGNLFNTMLQLPLPADPVSVLQNILDDQIISKAHAKASRNYAMGLTEMGTAHSTWYDLFNALTRGAQDMPELTARTKAEEAALSIFMDGAATSGRFNRRREQAEIDALMSEDAEV